MVCESCLEERQQLRVHLWVGLSCSNLPWAEILLEQCPSTCWCGNFRFPDSSGRSRGKTQAGIVSGMLFLRGRVALCCAWITCYFMESLWGAHYTPGLIDHVQAARNPSPCSGLVLSMSLWTVGKGDLGILNVKCDILTGNLHSAEWELCTELERKQKTVLDELHRQLLCWSMSHKPVQESWECPSHQQGHCCW